MKNLRTSNSNEEADKEKKVRRVDYHQILVLLLILVLILTVGVLWLFTSFIFKPLVYFLALIISFAMIGA